MSTHLETASAHPVARGAGRSRVLIVGGGYVGLYAALGLQRKIQQAGGVVTLVDPVPYMTYQPFLPEVAGGNIEGRHAVVSHRRHLKHTELINGKVTDIDHAAKTATVEPVDGGEPFELEYDDLVMAAGAVTRTFPIPGLAEHGIGMKAIEEAVEVRNKVLERIEAGSVMTDPEQRRAALTFVVVGGGFAGIETIAEIEDMARVAVARNKYLNRADLRFVMVEAMGRIMPEVTEEQAVRVVEHLRDRGIEVLLNTSLASAEGGQLELINMPDKTPADSFRADTLIWTAGVAANSLAKSSGLPTEPRGRITVGADLQVRDENGVPVPGAWAAGDIAAVPDLSGGGLPDKTCVPNAQHALRQAKVLVKNVLASRNGGALKDYKHTTLGAVAGFGVGKGVAKIGPVKLFGLPAWLMHRGYHGMAMPMFERKFRVISDWMWGTVALRDTTQLINLDAPYKTFQEAAGKK